MSEPEEVVPALVAQVKLKTQEPRVNGGPPKLNNVTAADIARLNADKTIEHRVMNDRGRRFEPQPSDRNAASQAVNLFDMTFSQYGEARFGGSAFMRSRKVG